MDKEAEMQALRGWFTVQMQEHFAPEKAPALVFGQGNLSADLMLVGEAPGAREVELGQPFVGQAGKNLDEFLQAVGLDREDIYISNAVKFRPSQPGKRPGTFKNRPPTAAEVAMSRRLIIREILLVRPKVVATLGNAALKSVGGKAVVIGDCHGQPVPCGVEYEGGSHDFTLFALYHPASIIYNRSLADVYRADMQKLAQFMQAV
ncbi:MAG: uracil-DNA glycosylase [Christensenellales bacterium]